MTFSSNEKEGIQEKKVICWSSPGCTMCGLLVRVKDDKILSMRGDPKSFVNQGHVCKERFPHLLKWLNHPDQLKYPLKRAGERGKTNGRESPGTRHWTK